MKQFSQFPLLTLLLSIFTSNLSWAVDPTAIDNYVTSATFISGLIVEYKILADTVSTDSRLSNNLVFTSNPSLSNPDNIKPSQASDYDSYLKSGIDSYKIKADAIKDYLEKVDVISNKLNPTCNTLKGFFRGKEIGTYYFPSGPALYLTKADPPKDANDTNNKTADLAGRGVEADYSSRLNYCDKYLSLISEKKSDLQLRNVQLTSNLNEKLLGYIANTGKFNTMTLKALDIQNSDGLSNKLTTKAIRTNGNIEATGSVKASVSP